MTECVVMVRFEVEPGRREAFLPVIEANAAASLAEEPGCRRFDVILPNDEPDVVLLYEVYEDAEAFARHRQTPHYARFGRESEGLLRSRQVTVGAPSPNAPAPKATSRP